ncbi:DMT family transporter [Candidatus Epulonipiscium viviparus]|uniref:DMT family transporter n=1 Tax=Candidatus Epulonipiscium viviparus TaxID=420336 RepID=UPI00016BFB5C|nr:DMT family transporter [Candidatus Epulopiscium viviparus]
MQTMNKSKLKFTRLNNRTKGILFILVSALSFALMSACIKIVGPLPIFQKVFFRNLISLFIATALVLKHKSSFVGKPENRKYLILRAVLGTAGIIFNFYAIEKLVLSDATMLNKLSPLFVILFSYLFLKEHINRNQIVAITIAFLGALLILKPSFNSDMIPGISGILGALSAGAGYTCLRILKTEPYYRTVFAFSAVSCAIVLPFAIYFYLPMTSFQFLTLMLAGVFATITQFSLTLAYSFAPAREISIFDYSNIIFSAIISYFLFYELPDILSVIGYFVIFGASLYMFLYQKNNTSSKTS